MIKLGAFLFITALVSPIQQREQGMLFTHASGACYDEIRSFARSRGIEIWRGVESIAPTEAATDADVPTCAAGPCDGQLVLRSTGARSASREISAYLKSGEAARERRAGHHWVDCLANGIVIRNVH